MLLMGRLSEALGDDTEHAELSIYRVGVIASVSVYADKMQVQAQRRFNQQLQIVGGLLLLFWRQGFYV